MNAIWWNFVFPHLMEEQKKCTCSFSSWATQAVGDRAGLEAGPAE